MMKLITPIILCLLMAPNAFSQAVTAPVGVQLYSYREQFKKDARGTFQRIKDLGIKELEVGGFYDLSPQDFKKIP